MAGRADGFVDLTATGVALDRLHLVLQLVELPIHGHLLDLLLLLLLGRDDHLLVKVGRSERVVRKRRDIVIGAYGRPAVCS